MPRRPLLKYILFNAIKMLDVITSGEGGPERRFVPSAIKLGAAFRCLFALAKVGERSAYADYRKRWMLLLLEKVDRKGVLYHLLLSLVRPFGAFSRSRRCASDLLRRLPKTLDVITSGEGGLQIRRSRP